MPHNLISWTRYEMKTNPWKNKLAQQSDMAILSFIYDLVVQTWCTVQVNSNQTIQRIINRRMVIEKLWPSDRNLGLLFPRHMEMSVTGIKKKKKKKELPLDPYFPKPVADQSQTPSIFDDDVSSFGMSTTGSGCILPAWSIFYRSVDRWISPHSSESTEHPKHRSRNDHCEIQRWIRSKEGESFFCTRDASPVS